MDVTNIQKSFDTYLNISTTNYVHWTINTSSLLIDWNNPTLKQVFNGESLFPTDYNVLAINVSRFLFFFFSLSSLPPIGHTPD